MKQSLARHTIEQWQALCRDPWLLSLVSWVPVLLFVTLWSVFSSNFARNLPVGVVDLDQSRLSRSLIRHYDASPTIRLELGFGDVARGAEALRRGAVFGLIIMPPDFERDTVSGRAPTVSAMVTGQYLLVGKNVNSALSQAHATFTAGVESVRNLSTISPLPSQALAAAVPFATQVTPLFNSNTNYAQFLVSAMLPAMWQILMVATTIMVLADGRRRDPLCWPGDEPGKRFAGMVLALVPLFLLHGAWYLSWLYVIMDWPMHGSWPVLILAQLLTVVGSIGIGALFFLFTLDAARALSIAAFYAASSLAFMGVTFPVTDMVLPARIWRSLVPICHYIEIQIAQVDYGAPLSYQADQLLWLGGFCITLLFGSARIRRIGAARKEAGA
jgi:ABC-2 type transport system permease protein